MGDRERATSSGRLVVQKFAAHLAHLLNTGDGTVRLNAGELYRKLLKTLSGGGANRENEPNPYVDKLVARHLLGPDTDPDQAAVTYFERVLNRPLHLARREHHHKGHQVFLALCHRGVDLRWQSAQLIRSTNAPSNTDLAQFPPDFNDVRDRVLATNQRHRGHISPGNPAASTRAQYGPLCLTLGGSAIEVAEELSVWEGICNAPNTFRILARQDFDEFCSLMIKAVETANAPYGALVTLGLSPIDWSGELSVNTAKKVSAFLSDVRLRAAASGSHPDAIETWQEVWADRQIPGFASPQAFWSSPLGHAVRLSAPGLRPSTSETEDETDFQTEAKVDRRALPEMLETYARAGLLDWYDVWLLGQLNRKKTLQQLARSPRTLFKFGKAEIPESYIDELRERIRDHRPA